MFLENRDALEDLSSDSGRRSRVVFGHVVSDRCQMVDGSMRPELFAFALRQLGVDLLQVVRAVMARDALQVDAVEVLEQHHGHLVSGILVHDLGAVVAELRPTDEVARGADAPVAARLGDDHLRTDSPKGWLKRRASWT